MFRFLLLATALVAGLVSHAIAGDPDKKAASEAATPAGSTSGNPFTMENAREHLLRQGYTAVSELVRDESGKWVGTATKDGKSVPVAVDVKASVAN